MKRLILFLGCISMSMAVAAPYDGRGDIDMNGRPCELEDVQASVQYLLKGPRTFDLDVDAQTNAADLNYDGDSESAADLQRLINCYNGIEFGSAPDRSDTVVYSYHDSTLMIGSPVAALYLTLDHDCAPEAGTVSGNMIWYYENATGHLKLVIYSLEVGTTCSGAILHGLGGEIVSINAAAPDGSAVFLERTKDTSD